MRVIERQLIPEKMDDPTLDRTQHVRALNGLRRINAWSRTASTLWREIALVASEQNGRPLKVLDVACGGGDLAVSLARYAKKQGIEIEVHGCDISPTAVEHATDNAQRNGVTSSRFYVHNALEQTLPEQYDVITCTLFLHHLQDHEVVALLQNVAQSVQHTLLADDLIRNRTGYWLAQLGCRVLSRSPIVHYDGPASVRGAYTMDEMKALAAKAGLAGVEFRKHWPERYLMSWKRAA